MLPLLLTALPVLLLLLTPLVMLIVRLFRPRFGFFWIIALTAALIAWVSILLTRLRIPLTVPLAAWQPEALFPLSPTLLIDQVSWSLALALITLTLAALLTDVARPLSRELRSTEEKAPNWMSWASSLAISGLGLLAVFAGNLLTVLLTWTALDLVEVIIWLSHVRASEERERVVITTAARFAGTLTVIWATMTAHAAGEALTFTTLSNQTSTYLLIAVGMRLGVLPVVSPLARNIPHQRALGSLLRLVPAAASLALLPRVAMASINPAIFPYLILLTGLAALYGSFAWVAAANEVEGQGFWIIGMAAMSLAAAMHSQPAAALSWGLALLLGGGMLCLASLRHRRLTPMLLLGGASMAALPFTPTWQGVFLFSYSSTATKVIFLAAHASLLAGYLRHAARRTEGSGSPERYVWLIYPWGLALPILINFAIAWWNRAGLAGMPQTLPTLLESWPGFVSCAIAGLGIWWRSRRSAPSRLLQGLQKLLSLNWLYRLLVGGYYLIRRALFLVSDLLEGQAGILWALLLILLSLSLLIQGGAGG